eukprot:TRINITY_DN9635_c0_g1_i1.p1 TRINITY_DN9635_c0_g1~~TRINITY_DN9635_c0_g1_i1.p1  ORF type:complete len:502 (+),score=70.94 TRINITY_DN9635_c0_g1_i1:2-1507(+)
MAVSWQFVTGEKGCKALTDTYNATITHLKPLDNAARFDGTPLQQLHLLTQGQAYANLIRHVQLSNKKGLASRALTSVYLSSLSFFQYELYLVDSLDYIHMLSLLVHCARHTQQTSFTIWLRLTTSGEGLHLKYDDWQIQASSSILISQLAQVLEDRPSLHLQLLFSDNHASLPACVFELIKMIAGLLHRRNRFMDGLALVNVPEAVFALCSPTTTDAHCKSVLRFQLILIATTSALLGFFLGSARAARFHNLAIAALIDLEGEPEELHVNIRGSAVEMLTNTMAQRLMPRAMFSILDPGTLRLYILPDNRAYDTEMDNLRLSHFDFSMCETLEVPFLLDHTVATKCPMLKCGRWEDVDYLQEAPVLLLSHDIDRAVADAIEQGTFSSTALCTLHLESHNRPWTSDYSFVDELAQSCPNLIEFSWWYGDRHWSRGFYQRVKKPFVPADQYGYILIGRQQVAAMTMALDLAGVDVSDDVVCQVLLPKVVEAERRELYQDLDSF